MKKTIFVAIVSFFAISITSNAQSLSDLFNKENISKVVSAVTNNSNNTESIVGTWTYEGSAVDLQSGNMVKNIGGKVATSTIEKNLDKQFSKVGIQEGISSFTFNTDSTFTVTLKSKTQNGTYSLDSKNKKLDLTFVGRATLSANYELSNSDLTLTFDADKIVTVVSYISKLSSNSSLNTVSSLLQSYDGVMAGFALKKQN